ncbi:hypothetical protein ACN0IV_12890 [Trabulsiella odontotermitis]|uniref:hypothetical protein n=1 Tax=Trabulsiella odontotermitis TaxID=379893 RepID=UPI003AD1801E
MSEILEKMSAMGKATTIEIAAVMGIEPVDMLPMLRELEESGAIEQVNGFWSVFKVRHTTRPPETEMMQTLSAAGCFDQIKELLLEHGPMTTADIAKKLKRNSRALNPIMHTLSLHGKIKKHGAGKAPAWQLPDQGAAAPAVPAPVPASTPAAVPAPTADLAATSSVEHQHPSTTTEQPPEVTTVTVAHVEKPVQELIAELPEPVSTQQEESRPDDLIIPSLRRINRDIQSTRRKLAQLEKVRDVVRAVNQHKKLLQELAK